MLCSCCLAPAYGLYRNTISKPLVLAEADVSKLEPYKPLGVIRNTTFRNDNVGISQVCEG